MFQAALGHMKTTKTPEGLFVFAIRFSSKNKPQTAQFLLKLLALFSYSVHVPETRLNQSRCIFQGRMSKNSALQTNRLS